MKNTDPQVRPKKYHADSQQQTDERSDGVEPAEGTAQEEG